MSEHALWLYGIAAGDAEPPDVTGVDAEPVEPVREGALAALAGRVPLERFGAEALRRDLERLEVLERLARAHERVLDAALERGPVLPARLCTLYTDDAALRALLRREVDPLGAALERLRGTTEWGVKAWHEPRPAGAAASGADYLARKREQRSATHALDDSLGAIHDRLRAAALDGVLSRPQDGRLSRRSAEMVLNASYLVPDGQAGEFERLVAALADEHGVELELTGPWPPYHFAAAP